MTNKYRIWKSVEPICRGLILRIIEGVEYKHSCTLLETSVKQDRLREEFWTQVFRNTKQECWTFDYKCGC
jgi:hypothetical protein